MLKLSILICTLGGRKNFYNRLMECLTKQADRYNLWNHVEVLSDCDNGELSIGAKRNKLLDLAKGEYTVFIDDDDVVSEEYIKLILDAIDNNPDVIGIHLLMTTNGCKEERTYHSLKYTSWWDEPDPDRLGRKRYFRNPNHLNPVKRKYALKVRFPEINNGEDRVYSQNLLSYLKTEVCIDQPIYYYLYRSIK